MPSPAFVPRKDRDSARGKRAAEAVRARGGSAMEIAEAHIEGVFQWSFLGPSMLKEACARLIRCGAGSCEVRTRFYRVLTDVEGVHGAQASLRMSISCVEAMHKRERLEREIKFDLGYTSPRVREERLEEARLLLRWLRAKGYGRAFPQIFEVLTTPLHMQAPELVFAEAAE
jgi:hypothetical protein